MPLTYETVDVFTDQAFGGNPLAVVFGGEDLNAEAMQAITREFNYSESTFLLPPRDPAHTAQVRIFTPTREVPFAGHPNVGTATVLAWRGEVFGKPVGEEIIFEEEAGLVPISVRKSPDGDVLGAMLTAPQPFEAGMDLSVAAAAECLGLPEEAIRADVQAPVLGSVGLPFFLVELADRQALEAARPVKDAFQKHIGHLTHPDIHCYVRTDGSDGIDVRTRMFAPLDGIDEDPATGSANCALVGLLASHAEQRDGTLTWTIAQGVEMGRPSKLDAEVDRSGGSTTAIRIGGQCVAMMRGEFVGL